MSSQPSLAVFCLCLTRRQGPSAERACLKEGVPAGKSTCPQTPFPEVEAICHSERVSRASSICCYAWCPWGGGSAGRFPSLRVGHFLPDSPALTGRGASCHCLCGGLSRVTVSWGGRELMTWTGPQTTAAADTHFPSPLACAGLPASLEASGWRLKEGPGASVLHLPKLNLPLRHPSHRWESWPPFLQGLDL